MATFEFTVLKNLNSWTAAACVVVAIAACGGGNGGSTPPPLPTPLSTPVPIPTAVLSPLPRGSVVTNEIRSTVLGASYRLATYLPADYASTQDVLPGIYITDGEESDWNFQSLTKALEELGIRAVVVGIGTSYRREVDYLLPGADYYYKFLTEELIPFIEPKFRMNPKGRTLSGHSHGATFTQTAMMLDRPTKRYFKNFVALDGSYWIQLEQLNSRETEMHSASGGRLPETTLVLASARVGGNFGNYESVQDMFSRLYQRNYQGLNLNRFPAYPNGHGGMYQPAIKDAMSLLFLK